MKNEGRPGRVKRTQHKRWMGRIETNPICSEIIHLRTTDQCDKNSNVTTSECITKNNSSSEFMGRETYGDFVLVRELGLLHDAVPFLWESKGERNSLIDSCDFEAHWISLHCIFVKITPCLSLPTGTKLTTALSLQRTNSHVHSHGRGHGQFIPSTQLTSSILFLFKDFFHFLPCLPVVS